MILIGYHGCDVTVRDGLIARTIEHLRPSKNPYDWLGTGAYFFDDDAKRAMKFARAAHENPEARFTAKPIVTPAVVGCVIELNRVWDLGKTDGQQYYRDVFESMRESFAADNKPMPVNKRKSPDDDFAVLRGLDRAVIDIGCNLAAATGKPYDAVVAAFPQGKKLSALSGFSDLSHRQISLRDPSQTVRGYFHPCSAVE